MKSETPPRLPVDRVRNTLLEALERGGPHGRGRAVVLSSPTGSGKSTQVPRWCPGPVLVVEPRRVACRSLAQRVAMLEGCKLGEEVGYHVRDERRANASTRILFATPGVVLRLFDRLDRFATIVVDEFHERGLEVDLLLALL
ncbi:MAG: DEAD/DEAH box helicase, partial [Acidobacteriota bacterium]